MSSNGCGTCPFILRAARQRCAERPANRSARVYRPWTHAGVTAHSHESRSFFVIRAFDKDASSRMHVIRARKIEHVGHRGWTPSRIRLRIVRHNTATRRASG